MVTLFHAASNTVAFSLLRVDPAFGRHYVMTVAAMCVVTLVVVAAFGARTLSRRSGAARTGAAGAA